MNEEIANTSLVDFIEIARENEIDFSKYTYDCGATKFVDETLDVDWQNDKFIRTYYFKDFYLDREYLEYKAYFVLSIPNKSYLMYELLSEIIIWVCYTEEAFRGNGLIVKLLKSLIERHPEKTIVIDTYNESLRKSCLALGINLFRK